MPGLIRGVARTAVIAGTASTVAGRVNHRQQQKWAGEGQPAQPAQPQYAAPPPQYVEPAAAPEPQEDPMERLKKLAELRDAGILTEEEFSAEKAKILNG